MITKWNRESFLVTLMGFMILIAIFYYGGRYFIDPLKEEADILTETVRTQQSLIESYPPTEELKTSYEENYLETESYLPLGAQANQELINLEDAADDTDVDVMSVSRIADRQPIEQATNNFVKNTYDLQMASESPENFRRLIDRLMKQERVWNITTFTYDKIDEETYTGTLTFELPYYSETAAIAEEPSDEMEEENVE